MSNQLELNDNMCDKCGLEGEDCTWDAENETCHILRGE